ncbi:MAG: hypothetical protein IJ711_11810, partial [Lachnospiraceae bacterium]|nr:hypothetical protein [Lachnospiraceae bacterium]
HVVHVGIRYEDKQKYGKLRILGIPVVDFFPSEEKRKKKEEKRKRKEEKRRRKEEKQRKRKKTKRAEAPKNKDKAGNAKKNGQNVTADQEASQAEKITQLKQTSRKEQTAQFERQEQTEERLSVWKKLEQKVLTLVAKLKLFFQKVIDKLKNFKYTIDSFLKKMHNVKETVFSYVELLQREETKRAIATCKTQLKRLLRHLKPKRFEGVIEFGLGDPGKTGDLFSKLCMMYPFYAKHIVLIPDFENSVFKGKLFIKGRIRLAALAAVAWKVVFDKDVRKLYKIVTGGAKHESG